MAHTGVIDTLIPRETPGMDQVDSRLLDQAIEWSRAAGELTLEWFNNPELSIDAKGDGSPVTQADRAAETLLRELIAAEYPEDSIIGEEFPDKVGTSGRRWVIDPIDGTKPFMHGVGTYSNLLYMEDDAGGAVGVINLPALGENVAAGRGLGCFSDGTACRVSTHDRLEGAYVSCTAFHGWDGALFDRVTGTGAFLQTWGDAYGYALVASGRIEAMTDPVLAWWDLAALTVILPEAGGTITTWDGAREFEPDANGLYSAVASNGVVHDALIEVLAG